MLDRLLLEVIIKIKSLFYYGFYSILVPENDNQFESNELSTLRLYRVPLEHFPSLESYYPERIVSSADEIESTIETKPSQKISSQAKKNVVTTEIDKTLILFDEKIKETFRKRYSNKISSNFCSLFFFSV
jgi:hypothetical protein